MRLFLDANVLFAAAKSSGAVRRLLELLLDRTHVCCVDAFVVGEARRNLERKAPDGLVSLELLLDRLEVMPIRPIPPDLESQLPVPPKDRPVLAAAILHQCDALVTGDRTHFGPLYGRRVHGVRIHSPRSIAELLLE